MNERALICLLSLASLLGVASADTVELKDGSTIQGEIVSTEKGQVRVRIVLKSGASATLTIAKKDVVAVRFDETEPQPDLDDDPLSGIGKTRARKTKGQATKEPALSEEKKEGKRTIYLLDHSGSMAIGKRWEQAVLQTERLVRRLKPGAPFDVMLFSAHVRSLFTKDNTSFRSKTSAERVAAALRADPPELRAGTHFVRALRRAVARHPKKIVLITDGVGTLGGPFAGEDAFRVVSQARAQGIPVDVLAAQDGTFVLAPTVEDLAASRLFLQRLARAGGGVFLPLQAISTPTGAPLPEAFHPTTGTPDGTQSEVRFQVVGVLEKKVISTGRLPTRFRIRVSDPLLARLKTPDVWEYGGAAVVELHGPSGIKRLRLELVDGWFVTQQEVMVTSKSRPGGIVHRDRVLVSSVSRIVYRRGTRTFVMPFGRTRRPNREWGGRRPCEPSWIEVGQDVVDAGRP